ncbi:plasmid mobilization protein [Streptomyces lasiicapitis]|uniref:plasmid mobilization protein n=1 Tax=Streptomyces lasiicapitis TaxID=1923961 RepID=UPI00364639B0
MDGAKPVQVLFSPDEYAAVARHADRLGITVAEFIRRAAAVHAGQDPDTCGSGGARRTVVVPPVRRGPDTRQAPALQRFLDTLTTTDPARIPQQQQPTVRNCSGP